MVLGAMRDEQWDNIVRHELAKHAGTQQKKDAGGQTPGYETVSGRSESRKNKRSAHKSRKKRKQGTKGLGGALSHHRPRFVRGEGGQESKTSRVPSFSNLV